jgi:hypothetical protein
MKSSSPSLELISRDSSPIGTLIYGNKSAINSGRCRDATHFGCLLAVLCVSAENAATLRDNESFQPVSDRTAVVKQHPVSNEVE